MGSRNCALLQDDYAVMHPFRKFPATPLSVIAESETPAVAWAALVNGLTINAMADLGFYEYEGKCGEIRQGLRPKAGWNLGRGNNSCVFWERCKLPSGIRARCRSPEGFLHSK